MIFNKVESKFLIFWSKLIVGGCIFMTLISILDFPHNIGNYAWQLLGFSLVAGGFILSIKDNQVIGKEQIAIFTKIGFAMIFSSLLLFIGHGLSLGEGSGFINGIVVPYLSVGIVFLSILILSIALTILFFESAKIIFSKK